MKILMLNSSNILKIVYFLFGFIALPCQCRSSSIPKHPTFSVILYCIILLLMEIVAQVPNDTLQILKAQEIDTIAVARITNAYRVQPDTLQFDLRLFRKSDKWDRWANGTFQINLSDSSFKISSDSLIFEYVQGTSDLNIQPITGELPTVSYYLTPRIIKNRLSITIAGPEAYGNCKFVPPDSSILIGTFIIATKNGSMVPEKLMWLQPQFYYQACAYKKELDSTVQPQNIQWGNANANYEMDDGPQTTFIRYEVEDIPPPEMILKFFTAEYAGLRKVKLDWATVREAFNKGFILRRGLVPLSTRDTTKVVFDHLVATFEGQRPEEKELKGLGTRNPGKDYIWYYDTVQYRGEEYCYALYYKDFEDVEHYLAMACVPIPNSVITYAQANPNPMSVRTTIKYNLDDDVILECNVYDVIGKHLVTLIPKQYAERGMHEVVFDAPRSDFASQGLYEVVFIAYPVDDPSVEISRAIVKVQLIR